MRAIRYHEYGDPAVLKLEEVDPVTLNEGDLRVKVVAAGVNFADSLQRRNLYPVPGSLPRIPGFEVSGVIEELGPNTEGFKVGDRIVSMLESGGYCESVVVQKKMSFLIPEGVSFEQAVALPGQALTAYFIYKDARLAKGETVLVHAAAGGVGSVSAQIAKLLGAGFVVGTSSTKTKLEKLHGYAYDGAVNVSEADWADKVSELTHGRGAHVILESIGGPVFDGSVKCLAEGGRLVVFGRAGGQPTNIDPQVLIMTNQTIMGFSLWKYMGQRNELEQAMDFLFHALIAGNLKVDLDIYPLEQAAEVHKMLESRNSSGKLVLKP